MQPDFREFFDALTEEQKGFLKMAIPLNPVRFLRIIWAAAKQSPVKEFSDRWMAVAGEKDKHPYIMIKWKPENEGSLFGEYACRLVCTCGQDYEFTTNQLGVKCIHCSEVFMASGGIGLVTLGKVQTSEDS